MSSKIDDFSYCTPWELRNRTEKLRKIPRGLRLHEDRFVEIVKKITPSFGRINLEDIATPKCFYILKRLQEGLDIPV